jgi:RNA polymerase sigma factor (sigma-70 family)
MAEPGDVTAWLARLQAGDPDAAQFFWDRYCRALVALARRRLSGSPLRAVDEEDVAQEVLADFISGLQKNQFQVQDRQDLWALLRTITVRKAAMAVRAETSRKRGGGAPEADIPLDQIRSPEPTPELAAEIAEECSRMLSLLNEQQRLIAVLKLEGLTNEEIAVRLGVSLATVERRLQAIRACWQALTSAPP